MQEDQLECVSSGGCERYRRCCVTEQTPMVARTNRLIHLCFSKLRATQYLCLGFRV